MPPDRTHRHRRTAALRAAARPTAARPATMGHGGQGAGRGTATLEAERAVDVDVAHHVRAEPEVDVEVAHDVRAEPEIDVEVEVEVVTDGDGCYSHVELLALARSVQAAAVVEDLSELARTVRSLREGLRCHVASEREGQDHLPAALRAVVFGGQDRLLRLVEGLALDLDADAACACLRHAAELVVALRRQAALEAAALRRPSDLA
ncbi:MAG TPA: hypothetical protein VFP06_21445 [Acidimicrobiales bacterium]|nr:hypothetical protein [Acidimicrobiales bacterium]